MTVKSEQEGPFGPDIRQSAGQAPNTTSENSTSGSNNRPRKARRPDRPERKGRNGNNGGASRGTTRGASRNTSRNTSQRQVYGALDLGTNNCRLLIAKPVHGGFRVIDAFSKIVRLGEGLNASGVLSGQAMDRAVGALASCAEKIERRQVTRIRSVATEACRVADNSADFVARVFDETRLALDVISAGEEARLAVLGCMALLEPRYDYAVVFDIGGGSTEVIWADLQTGDEPSVIDWVSMPYGVVNLAETIDTRRVTTAQYDDILDRVGDGLATLRANPRLNEAINEGRVQFVGTSGTVTTLMSVSLELPAYDRSKVDGGWIEAGRIRDIARSIAFMSADERAEHPCIGEERADLVVPGCAIFEAILNSWEIGDLRVADRGIREGVLRGLMRRDPLTNAKPKARSSQPEELRT